MRTSPGLPVSVIFLPSRTAGPEMISKATGELGRRLGDEEEGGVVDRALRHLGEEDLLLLAAVVRPGARGEGRAQRQDREEPRERKQAEDSGRGGHHGVILGNQTFTCTTFAGGNPLKWVDEAWL